MLSTCFSVVKSRNLWVNRKNVQNKMSKTQGICICVLAEFLNALQLNFSSTVLIRKFHRSVYKFISFIHVFKPLTYYNSFIQPMP